MSFPDPVAVVLVAVVGGILSLDATAALQSMVSQPIVTGPAVGLLVGDLTTGLIVGATLQMLFSVELPLGAAVPPDSCVAASAVTAGVAWGWPDAGMRADVAAAAILGFPAGWLAGLADQRVRRWNARWARGADAALAAGDPGGVDRAMHRGVATFLAKGIVACAVLPLACLAVLRLAAQVPFELQLVEGRSVYGWIALLAPAAGAGLVSRAVGRRGPLELSAAALAGAVAVASLFLVPRGGPWLALAAGTAAGFGVWVWRSR